ncbi:MAG: signal recognition particle protein Srp54 [Nanobdellota archaeon]
MVLDKLGSSLKGTLKKITNSLFVDEKLVNELVKDIQRALLQADVNVKLVFDLTKDIKQKALKQDIPAGLTKKEYLVNVVYESMTEFLGGEGEKIEITEKPFRIMLTGLFGNGKTTTAGKLAKYFSKRGHKVAVIQTDTWRPAAYDQLKQISEQVGVAFFGDKEDKDPVSIYEKNEEELNKYDVVIVDTAGRDALSDELIEEIGKIDKAVDANEKLLVMGADVGQAAQKQAQAFHDSCGVTGVIITKMDGTAKGGGALVACQVTEAPVKFIGTGEKPDAFEKFNPKGFVGRLLGMGDIEALLEKANEAFKEEDAKDMSKKFMKGEFTLIDLYEQMEAMKKMGPLNKVMDMIPGAGQMNIPKDMLQQQEGKLDTWKIVMNSCTKEELENPDIMDKSRVERIADGAGASVTDVREMLKHYKKGKKMMKMFKPGKGGKKKMEQMMKQMGGPSS